MKKLTLSILFLILFTFGSYANRSIKQEFNSKKDIDKVSFFRSISNEEKEENIYFFYTEFNILLKNYTKNILLRKQFLFALGLINQIQSQHLGAISRFNELIENSNYKLSARETMDIYIAMQESYLKLNLYSKVFDINKKINILISKGVDYPLWSYNVQSRLYLQLLQYDKAIVQLKKEIYLLYKNQKRDSLVIPSAYNDLGYYYHLKKEYISALNYYNKSIKTATKSLKKTNPSAYKNIILNSKSNIASLYYDKKEFEKTISIINNTILPQIDKKNITLYIQIYILLGQAYLKTNNQDKTKNIIEILEKVCCHNDVTLKIQFLELKSLYYEKRENFKSSLKYTSEINHLRDSLLYLQNLSLLKSTELNYFIENKEKEVASKNKIIEENKKTNLLIIIIGLIAILTTIIFAYKNNRNKKIEIEKINKFISKKNEEIKISLHEKELLLKEIHHRVKNNLQIISDILSLQSSNITDQKSKLLLAESQDRIQSIALLHKTMYQKDNFNVVNFQTYINELITYIKQTNKNLNKNITVKQKIEDLNFSIDTAIPLSMLINEIVTNCYKHAFINIDNGKIYISIQKNSSEEYLLSIKDNGVGLPKGYDKSLTNNIGFDLIYGLSEQLDGNVNINIDNGTEIIIAFKDTK